MLLHDRTRRKLAIGIFLTACVAPTVWVGAWCVRRQLPVVVEAEAAHFGRRLGLTVTLDDVAFVRPGTTEYRGVTVAHPETGRPLLRCGTLRLQRGRSAETGQPYVLLTPDAVEIESADAAEVVALLLRVLQGHGGWDGTDVFFRSAHVELAGQPASISPWTDVQAELRTVPGGVQWQMAMRLPGDASSRLARLRLWRDRQAEPARTGFEVQTGDGGLPVALAALLVPQLDALGAEARYFGRFFASQGLDGWEGEGSGKVNQVDLERLTSRTLGQRLTGRATALFDHVRVRRGRLEEAAGSVAGRAGTVSRSFIQRAQRECGLLPGNLPPTDVAEWPFEELALQWSVAAQGVTLHGNCAAPATGAILGNSYGPLLRAPADQPQPLAALVRFLCPEADTATAVMPATPQAAALLRYLPSQSLP